MSSSLNKAIEQFLNKGNSIEICVQSETLNCSTGRSSTRSSSSIKDPIAESSSVEAVTAKVAKVMTQQLLANKYKYKTKAKYDY